MWIDIISNSMFKEYWPDISAIKWEWPNSNPGSLAYTSKAYMYIVNTEKVLF